MKKKRRIWLWILCALLLLYFLSAFITRCSREQADFYDVVVVTGTGEETPLEKLDSWIANSLPYRLWLYMATPEDQRQAEQEAAESYEMEQDITE
ncbi:MAG: hypothetical protein IJ480_00695 [Clostridia bacterium]|nr:hypothetical protein [Clostridia bacterium]